MELKKLYAEYKEIMELNEIWCTYKEFKEEIEETRITYKNYGEIRQNL